MAILPHPTYLDEALIRELRDHRSYLETRMEPILDSIRDILLSRLPALASAVNGGASVLNTRTGGTSIGIPEGADVTIFLMIMSAIQMYVSNLFNLHIAVSARVAYAVLVVLGLPVLLVQTLFISFVLQFYGYMRLFPPRNGEGLTV